MSSIGEKSLFIRLTALLNVFSEKSELINFFSIIDALLGISDMPPYAIFALSIIFFLIKKMMFDA